MSDDESCFPRPVPRLPTGAHRGQHCLPRCAFDHHTRQATSEYRYAPPKSVKSMKMRMVRKAMMIQHEPHPPQRLPVPQNREKSFLPRRALDHTISDHTREPASRWGPLKQGSQGSRCPPPVHRMRRARVESESSASPSSRRFAGRSASGSSLAFRGFGNCGRKISSCLYT